MPTVIKQLASTQVLKAYSGDESEQTETAAMAQQKTRRFSSLFRRCPLSGGAGRPAGSRPSFSTAQASQGTEAGAHTSAVSSSGSAFRQSKNCRDTSLLVRSQTSRKTAANSTASSAAVPMVFFCGPGSRPPASAVRKSSRLSMTTAVGAITQLACTGRSSSTQKAAALRKNTVLFMFRGAPFPVDLRVSFRLFWPRPFPGSAAGG